MNLNLKNKLQRNTINTPFTFCVFFFFSFLLNAQEQLLTGEVISKDVCSEASHPVGNVFDNSQDTYFNSCFTFGNWVGLDLAEKHRVTKIVYMPRMDDSYLNRLELGVFEGANKSDFSDAIPLFIIPGSVNRGVNEQKIVCTRAFRYVRFVFPNMESIEKSSYLSELEFYGYKTEGTDEQLPRLTKIPTVVINTENNEDVVTKKEYLKAYISVISADGKKIQSGGLEIKGRGNNSWGYPKKPYRLKLDEKTNLLNLGAKEKNWALINNYGDKTLMRNLLAFDLSRRFEMEYTPAAVPVNVFLNGDYKGCYQLCDRVEVNEKRVPGDKMKKEDTKLPDLSGTYLIEIDAYANKEKSWFQSSGIGIPVTIKHPGHKDITSEQRGYITDHFNKLEDALLASNFKDLENGYRKYLDTKSFARQFIISEFSGNTDAYWSVYMYKKRGEDQFYVGPIWDLDLAYENDRRTYPINQNQDWTFATKGSCANGMRFFVDRVLSDESFFKEVQDVYAYYRDRGIISAEVLLKVVDEYAQDLDESQKLNFKRWKIMDTLIHENPVVWGGYEREVENVKRYISERIEWFDKKLSYVPNPVSPPEPINPTKLQDNAEEGSLLSFWIAENNLHLHKNSKAITVKIVDMRGQLLKEIVLGDEDLSVHLPRGLYMLLVTDSNKKSEKHKCIVF